MFGKMFLMELKDLKLTKHRMEICERLGLENSEDILNYYPFRYEEFNCVPYEEFNEGERVVLVGELISYPSTFRHGKLSTTRFKVLYDDEEIAVTIFNRPWIRNLGINDKITVVGKYNGKNSVTASNYYTKDVSNEIMPMYPSKEGISQNDIKKLIQYTYQKCGNELADLMPEEFVKGHGLIDYATAVRNIHFPESGKMLKMAMSRLKYEELLRFYVAGNILKGNGLNAIKIEKDFDRGMVDEFVKSFGYELTLDQEKCKDEILADLSSKKMMYRLVQGEVGSGKTAMAMIGLYANYLSGYQGALMAPTEILAKQHYETLKKAMEPFGVKVAVLFSAMNDEKNIKNMIRQGDVDVIVGTHALFSEDVDFKRLGLVIADEQHRFGVKQRKALKEKGKNCDFMLMSATPIPRTLASTVFGDMDVSTIETLPAGRKGCRTYLIKENSLRSVIDEIKAKLSEGRQVYIIASAIEKSDNYGGKDVMGLYEALSKEFEPYSTGLMHGRLSSEEKDEIMERFNRNEIQVLVSTTVVEVGVNVKNATVMAIYDADRFGLSQIHQLRGRVQRSSHEGTCYLLTSSRDAETLKRLQVLVDYNDGFKISYEDLRLRGPGDILGTRQSGLPSFILANIIEDKRFADAARADAQKICGDPDNEIYRDYYGKILEVATKNYID